MGAVLKIELIKCYRSVWVGLRVEWRKLDKGKAEGKRIDAKKKEMG